MKDMNMRFNNHSLAEGDTHRNCSLLKLFTLHLSLFTLHLSLFTLHLSLFSLISLIFFAGCTTTSVFETDKAHPSLEIDGKYVKFDGEIVSPYEVPQILEEHGVNKKTTIHIRVNQLDHLKEAQAFRHVLARAGYSRTALVTKEHAEAWSKESSRADAPAEQPRKKPRVRYRSANED